MIFALGIRFVGETVAKKLVQVLHDIEQLKTATYDMLIEIDEIGERIAQSVVQYFAEDKNIELINRLKDYGLQMAVSEKDLKPQSDTLKDKSIVISGTFQHHSRDEYKQMIVQHGGKNVSSISSKTSFVLAGEKMGPEKLKKAESLGIPILNEDEFLEMLDV